MILRFKRIFDQARFRLDMIRAADLQRMVVQHDEDIDLARERVRDLVEQRDALHLRLVRARCALLAKYGADKCVFGAAVISAFPWEWL